MPPVRLSKSSTAVKTKTSAPLPPRTPSCAVLTRCALCALSPHRKGTRSRRCGRRLTGAPGGPLTCGRRKDVGTAWAAPAEQATRPPPSHLSPVCFCWAALRLPTHHGLIHPSKHWWAEKRGSVGVPLPTSDQKSGLQARVRSTNTPLSFLTRVKLQGTVEFCGTSTRKVRPFWASPSSTVHRFVGKIKCFYLKRNSHERRYERRCAACDAAHL